MFSESGRRLWVYRCPNCGGDAYNGVPGSGFTFKGSAKCSDCSESFAVCVPGVKPISENGPLIGDSPGWFKKMCDETDARLRELNDE